MEMLAEHSLKDGSNFPFLRRVCAVIIADSSPVILNYLILQNSEMWHLWSRMLWNNQEIN